MEKPFVGAGVCLALLLALTGCSRAISTVKDADAPNAGFKIGQVLDHKANCTSSSWSQSTDENDRPVVTFECELTLPEEAFKQQKTQLHDDIARQFDAREKGGPYITTLDGEPEQYPLSASHYADSINSAHLRSDPQAAEQLDKAKAEYAQLVDDLTKADASCASSLEQRRKDLDARVDKYFADHSTVKETIEFTLKDDQIVERNLSASFDDGTAAMPAVLASLLYREMLDPSDPNAEYGVLTSSFMKRVGVGDIKYCDDIEHYKPFASRVKAVSDEILAADNTFSTDLHNRGN